MDHNMVHSYDNSSQNRRWRWTNVPPLRAILMAMAVRRCDTERIARCSMTRASPEATECHHQATTRYVLRRRPPVWQSTQRLCKIYPFADRLTVIAMRRYYNERIAGWRRFMAFIKATKCHHWASTRSVSIKRTRQSRLFRTFHHKKELQLTYWPLIIIGVWHIKLTGTT